MSFNPFNPFYPFGGASVGEASYSYFRPGGVDTYFRPGGVDRYIRP